jgi:integrase
LARYTAGDDGLLIITAAYTGMRWGELAGLQWIRTYLTSDPRIEIDPEFGALHEVRGRLTPGPPKTPASVRPIHLPVFLVELLTAHHQRNPQAPVRVHRADGGLRRRSNFRQRVWLPTLAGDDDLEWGPIQPGMHFHDLRHTHKTWLKVSRVASSASFGKIRELPLPATSPFGLDHGQLVETSSRAS